MIYLIKKLIIKVIENHTEYYNYACPNYYSKDDNIGVLEFIKVKNGFYILFLYIINNDRIINSEKTFYLFGNISDVLKNLNDEFAFILNPMDANNVTDNFNSIINSGDVDFKDIEKEYLTVNIENCIVNESILKIIKIK